MASNSISEKMLSARGRLEILNLIFLRTQVDQGYLQLEYQV